MTLRREDIRATKLEWLDGLPTAWDERDLGREVWVRARLGWRGLTADEYVDEGVPMLATPDIKSASIDYIGANKISQERYEESPEIMLGEGDVLLTKDGATIGIVNVVRDLQGPATVNGSIAVLTPTRDLDGRFLYWFLASSYAQATFDRLRGGMGVPHLFQRDINRIKIPYPPPREQRTIADYLDGETAKIDALIAEQRGLVGVLRERRVAVVFRAATKGLDSSAPLADSGATWLGAVPEHWTVATLRRVGRLVTGTTPPGASDESFDGDGEVGWARPEDLQRRVTPTKRLSPTGESQVRIVRDAVLICGIGATVGKVGVAEGRCSSNQQLTALITGQSAIYWYYALLAARAELVSLATGNTMPILNNERLGQLRVAVPPVKEQQEIAVYLDDETKKIDALIAEAEGIVEVAKERRSALITAAVTGQIDVRGEVA